MTGKRRHRTPLVHQSKKVLDDVRNEINVTPLVDVCLVLLIIFMVVTPLLGRGMDVQLPKTRHHNEKRDSGEQPVVSLVRDGARVRPYFDRDPLPDMEALKKRVQEELRRKPGQRIFVKADADLTFGRVYPALIAIHEAGSPGVELGTAEQKDK
ncbi:MAG: biopolymer transporter ExbD [Deltaproteobacteria bacterium]|nr:biopolymer transporter ExbD [Deltaproteobacteria bacterium]